MSEFIDLNNLALARLTAQERVRIGVHTCPGGDCDSTHSADIDYAELLPSLQLMNVTNFYMALAGEMYPSRVLKIIRDYMKPGQRIFVGVISPIDPHIETPEQVRDRVLEAARYIPVEQLATTDDCECRKHVGKLLIKPSRKSVRSLLTKVREIVKGNAASSRAEVIQRLNPVIRGWAMYHRHVVAKAAFFIG